MKHQTVPRWYTRLLIALACLTLTLGRTAHFGTVRADTQSNMDTPGLQLTTISQSEQAAPPIVSLQATPSTTKIAVAEPFTLRIETIAPQGSRIEFQSTNGSLGVFDVRDVLDSPDIPISPTQSKWTRLLTLETIQLGQQTIVPIEVTVLTGDELEHSRILQTEPISIDVQSVLDPSEQNAANEFRDIAGVIPLPAQANAPESDATGYLLVLLIGVGLLALAAWFRRRTHRRSRKWCLRQLNHLKQQPIRDAISFLETADALKRILRVSLKHSISSAPQPQTTQAIIDELRARQYDDSDLTNYHTAFRCADRLKFSSRQHESFSEEEATALRQAIEHAFRTIGSNPVALARTQRLTDARPELK